jgi:hypothetical protein
LTRVLPDADRGPLPGSARILAGASLAMWFLAVMTGRLMAYAGLIFGS